MLFLAFETDDTHSLVGIVDLLGTSIFVETSTSKKWKFKTEEIVATKLFFYYDIPFYFLHKFNATKKSLFKNHVRSIWFNIFTLLFVYTFPKFINMKCILNLLLIWPFELLLLMLDVDDSCSWVFAVDIWGGSYDVTSKKVKFICLVSNFKSSNSAHFVLVVKYIFHTSICLTFCTN